jgi:general secretion pathway protein G
MTRCRAFTLVEMLLVLAIAGVVLAIALPSYQSYVMRGRVAQAKVDISDIQATIKRYEKSKGELPDDLNIVGLATKTDPWGRGYAYYNIRTGHGNGIARKDKKLAPLNSDFDLYSIGPDAVTHASLGNSASRDDIVRARDGAFVGTAEEFDP